jgi:hypothetical protein
MEQYLRPRLPVQLVAPWDKRTLIENKAVVGFVSYFAAPEKAFE